MIAIVALEQINDGEEPESHDYKLRHCQPLLHRRPCVLILLPILPHLSAGAYGNPFAIRTMRSPEERRASGLYGKQLICV